VAKTLASSPAAPGQPIDVAAVLNRLMGETDEDLDWHRSIVDLMKLLKLDSSLTARKAARAGARVCREYERCRIDEHLAP
jgi:hypothetical protein